MMDQPKDNSAAGEVPTESNDQTDDFSTTQWSVVLEAGLADNGISALALEKLCARYWSPIHAFIRRQVGNAHEAEDLTQTFFAQLLNRETLKKVDRRKGKFRAFLLGELTDFLKETGKKKQASYPENQGHVISLNEVTAAELDRQQPVEPSTPEKLFDRGWALAVLETALNRLKQEYNVDGKTELYERLQPGLTGKADQGWYTILAAEMRMSEGSIRVALHRLRRRFGELLRKEVGRTVVDPGEVDEEIRHLFSVIEAGD
jgi:RNA polymerase sigma factor (sigma-70 family)